MANNREEEANVTENDMQEASENREEEEGERVMENPDEYSVRIMKQLYDIEWRLRTVEYEYKADKIEKSLVKFKCEHIRSEITIMNGVLQLEEYSNPEYLKDHVEGKLKCVIEELDDVISLKLEESMDEEEEGNINPYKWLQRHESSDSKLHLMQKEEIEVSKWLSAIAKRMEKIRMLVSQFSPQADETFWSPEEKTLSNSSACIDMCIEESLLISPMIATLKKSYDHLPTNLKLCSLCLAAFPDNFVIEKRPLIYWWMAEGFITTEAVGEENFMQLIRLGIIEPFYKDETSRVSSVQGVGACRVHPWIRRMLVSIAMDTQFFEFYGRQKKKSTSPNTAAGRPAHVCLLKDEDEAENVSFMRKIKILRWLKPGLLVCDKEINKEIKEARISDDDDDDDGLKPKPYRHEQEVWDMLFAFRLLILCVSKLDDDWISKAWHGDNHEALSEKLRELEADIHKNEKKLYDKQKKLQIELKELCTWAKQQVHDLEMQVYHRKKNRQELQRTEQLFAPYDLNVRFPACIHHQWDKPLFAIINVNQTYLNLEELVFGGKLNKLRTLHLGCWGLWQPYITVENTLFLNALFQVAKHLKYLSLSGVSTITSLPPSISNCCNLQVLDLKLCNNLEELPSEIGSLAKLTHFDVSYCYQLECTSLWTLVAKLKLLRTLKGLALIQDADLISLNSQITHNLMKLSIIVEVSFNEGYNLQRFCNLHVLTITWRKQDEDEDEDGFELPPQLRKLHLRRYPRENWPAWLKRHLTLETLYITFGNIRGFPDDLMLEKLQVLKLYYLTEFDKDIVEPGISRWFPSLKVLYDGYSYHWF